MLEKRLNEWTNNHLEAMMLRLRVGDLEGLESHIKFFDDLKGMHNLLNAPANDIQLGLKLKFEQVERIKTFAERQDLDALKNIAATIEKHIDNDTWADEYKKEFDEEYEEDFSGMDI